MLPFESHKKINAPELSILKKLRKELTIRLPISGYTVTIYEPLVASVHQLRNKFFGITQQILAEYSQSLQKAADETTRKQIEQEMNSRINRELQIFVFDALYRYVSENVESTVPIDEFAAPEVLIYIPTLLELLAHGWVIKDIKVICPAKTIVEEKGKNIQTICNYEGTANLVFNPIYFTKAPDQITEQEEVQFIDNVVKLHKLKTTLLSRLSFQVPEKLFTPVTVTSTIDTSDTQIQIETHLAYVPTEKLDIS